MNIKICFKSDWMIHSERCPTTDKRSVIGFNISASNKKTPENREGLSYKRGNSHPLNLDIIRVKLLWLLFWVRIAKNISEIKMLINIDKSSLTRGTTKKLLMVETRNIVFYN